MKRYYIIYEGLVQGVGFRWRLANIAKRYNFTGYCRNLSNGNVECEIQGNDVDAFLKDSLSSDTYAEVYNYTIKELEVKLDENNFKVVF